MDWKKILEGDAGSREHDLKVAIDHATEMEDASLESEVRSLIETEYAFDDESWHEVSLSRLRALLALDEAHARRFVDVYDRTMNSMPGEIAFRRAALVQSLARAEFSPEEESRLRALVPNVFGDKPREVSVGTPGPQEPERPYPRKRWGLFWRRKQADAREAAERR